MSQEPQRSRPNIVYIMADDMGYGDLGCYNPDSRIPTPNIDRLAREGVRFTDAHSPSAVCTPTRYGVLTGRYCWRSRLEHGVLFAYEPPLIEASRQTVAGLLREARAAIPGLAVTTDVIVGFPGETDAEFVSSARFIADMQFARVHVFPYSERPGTPAADMPDPVDPAVRKQRAQRVRAIGQEGSVAFRRQFLGCRLPVLWERSTSGGRWSGLTDNYIRVFAESDHDLSNTIRSARLVALEPNGMIGRLD